MKKQKPTELAELEKRAAALGIALDDLYNATMDQELLTAASELLSDVMGSYGAKDRRVARDAIRRRKIRACKRIVECERTIYKIAGLPIPTKR